MQKTVVFSKKKRSKKKEIRVTAQDFLNYPLDKKINSKTVEEMLRIERFKVNNNSIIDYFEYKDVSLWWLIKPSVRSIVNSTIHFITYFSKFLDDETPDEVIIEDEFFYLKIIEQVCKQKNIPCTYSKYNLKKYNVLSKLVRHRNALNRKRQIKFFNRRRENIFIKKNVGIPDPKNKILFVSGSRFRRSIVNTKKQTIENGEYLLEKITEYLKDEEVICIDHADALNASEKSLQKLEERLDSSFTWIPTEGLTQKKKTPFVRRLNCFLSIDVLFTTILHNNAKTIKGKITTLINRTFTELDNEGKNDEIIKFGEKFADIKQFETVFVYDNINYVKNVEFVLNLNNKNGFLQYWLTSIDKITRYLSSNRPKHVFMINELVPIPQVFIQVCKKFNIKTTSIQHGMSIEDTVLLYWNLTRHLENKQKKIFPDNVLLFGKITKEMLEKIGHEIPNLTVFGNPEFFNLHKQLDYLQKRSSQKELKDMKNEEDHKLYFQKSFRQRNQIDDDKKIILFCSTGLQNTFRTPGKLEFDVAVLEQILKYFSNDGNFQILLKPHHLENLKNYQKIIEEFKTRNIKIVNDNIYELIYNASVVISTISTVIADAICLNAPVIQVVFDEITVHMPWDNKYDIVTHSRLEDLQNKILETVNKDTVDIKDREIFLKDFFNVPEENPELILKKILE